MDDVMFLLADGATKASGWASEEGIAAIVSMAVTVLTVLRLLLERAGRVEAAAKAAGLATGLEKGATTVGALVGAIAELRRTGQLGPIQAQALLAKIKSTTSMLDVDKVLDAIVQSEKAAPAANGAAPLAAIEAAKAALSPATPEPATLLRRLTGRA